MKLAMRNEQLTNVRFMENTKRFGGHTESEMAGESGVVRMEN